MKKIFIFCQDEDSTEEVARLFRRVSAVVSAVDTFADKFSELDEDAPNLSDLAEPLITRLTLTLMRLYPDYRQMQIDAKSIGDFTITTHGDSKAEGTHGS